MKLAARRLHLILGDQLDARSSIFDDFDPDQDRLWMAEVHGENTHVPHHKHQIILFLSAMRHFAAAQENKGRPVVYTKLGETDASDRAHGLPEVLALDLHDLQPQEVRVVLPGDKRVLAGLRKACDAANVPLRILEDRHFFCSPARFAQHRDERKSLRLEFFYREMRQEHGLLLDERGGPVGGQWNYDADNRQSFGKGGPPPHKEPHRFQPCEVVREVADLVEKRYPNHWGRIETFALPVRREQALVLLQEFLEQRLARFGEYQDAMWQGEFFLFHSRISTSLNLKLLSPAEVCTRAEQAYRQGKAPLNAVEGFIRQILGWREYIRGVYWTAEEGYEAKNFLQHHEALPEFFWTGQTEMRCLNDTLRGVQDNAYSHHIQRLMVTGLFCLLYGVEPSQFNDWHVATHCDAIDWVSLPNVHGMSQFADGGLLASKPYCASGNYINKMSNYCKDCVYNPKLSVGEKACPFTTLYWEFLDRHHKALAGNARMKMQLLNLERKSSEERAEIRQAAKDLRQRLGQDKVADR